MGQGDTGQAGSVLVLAPYARDTALTCDLLHRAGIPARSCADIEELCRRLNEAAGAVLAMEEALAVEALAHLVNTLRQQPRWSDIPVLVVVDAQHKPDDVSVRRFTASLANVMLITRPAHPVTLLSAVRSALRARERQYRLRDALGPYEESHSRLLAALPLAALVHLDGRVIYANPAAAALLGADSVRALVGRPLTGWLHPDFAAATEERLAALAGGGDACSEVQRWIRVGGEEIDVEVDLAPMVWGRRPAVRVTARRIGASPVAGAQAQSQTSAPADAAPAFAHLPVTLFTHDRELRYLWVHRLYTGERPEHAVGRRDLELLPQREEAAALEAFKREALAAGGAAQRRFRLTLPEGERHLDVRVEPLRDRDGSIAGLAGAAIDVTEYASLEAQLRQQAAQLTRTDQRKNEFLAQLAHELRNPLAPIHNAVHVMRIQGDPPDPSHVRWAVEVVGRQVQQLTRLVDDLLDVARIAHGKVTLRREPVELGRILTQAIEAARPLATARKQTLTYGPPLEPLPVQADPTRLTQIVVNLLNNAARYTPVGGDIGLSAEAAGGCALIRVKDNGIGIAAEERERIFEPFQQGRHPPDAAPAGLGIGLALVKHLTALHQGTVEVRSGGPGKGSEFLVRLPLAPPSPAPAPVEPQQESAWRVLVVDDDPDVAHSFALLLGLMGYQVRVANDGSAGLKTAASFRPHVTFIDIGLPDMDGYALARALRRSAPDAPPMRLVALTGYTQDEVRERAVTAGFDAHLLKPVGADTLERLLQSFLPQRQL